ncbi:hypothetical protein EMPS_09723 [Entomortierella parvispora]|uniref:Uncharacterized protein n=1 Tax=Entomortierella parvispora TaxID=205924 RepID=A0A9P3M0J1_9FUNG|nr:hypothetical protein EMPS_09723 [Entomortierella parvispora]
MDMLANYASESDSDTEHVASVNAPKQQAPIHKHESRTHASVPSNGANEPSVPGTRSLSDPSVTQAATGPTDLPGEDVVMDDSSKPEDEAFISNSLKFLQDFAASVDPKPDVDPDTQESTTMDEGIGGTTPTSLSEAGPVATLENTVADSSKDDDRIPSPTIMTPEQQVLFDAFMAQIDALPLTRKDQTRPPLSSKPGSSMELDLKWQQEASVQSIYSRIHQLSLLSSPLLQSQAKELEKALIKFAIRILDWEKNGLKPSYFLGEQRSEALNRRKQLDAQDNDGDVSMDEDMEKQEESKQDSKETGELPPYGGVVGSMLETMTRVEQEAAPSEWKVIWDPQEDAYKFFHIKSGTISTLYPSIQLLHQLDPPSSKSKSPPCSPIDIQ